MHNFILKRRPVSYNSCRGAKKIRYKEALERSFGVYNQQHSLLENDLYAVLYYFYKENLDLDTDNLSKPVWDCLGGFLFNDDQQIKMRIAGSFNLLGGDYNIIDFTGLDGTIITDLIEAFETENHVVYVECGKFDASMYKFNIEQNGNQ